VIAEAVLRVAPGDAQAGQPLVYAKDAPLPRSSLNGEMTTTQADVKLTSRIGRTVSVRAGYRYFDLDDGRPEIQFPGYSSSGDSYFRRGVGQTTDGQKALFNEVGGYTRQRFNVGAGVRVGPVTVDGEFPKMPDEGIIAWQLHAGGSMEVTFRNIRFQDLSKK